MHISGLSKLWALAAVACLLGLPRPGWTAVAEVTDGGKFFSKEAIEKANYEISEIARKYHKDLMIETFASVPADKKAAVQEMDAKARGRFFNEWAAERARQMELNGIYILICREPSHLQVDVGRETAKKAFPPKDRDELAERLLKQFKGKHYDDGLLEAVSFVRTSLRGHIKLQPNPDHREVGAGPALDWKAWVCPAIAILGAVWLVFALIRAFSGMGARGGYGTPGTSGAGWGGGGFMTGLLGGLFGAVAGNWIYNSFFGGHGGGWGASSAYGADTTTDGFGPSDEGQGFDGSGGDFGDAGGGGDFGGGDMGGGDWGGGGDFGGGGGDF